MAVRVKGLKELSAKAREIEAAIGPEVEAEARKAATKVKTEAKRVASTVDNHADTAADHLKVEADAKSSRVILERTDEVPYAIGSEWGSKYDIERKSRKVWFDQGYTSTGRKRRRKSETQDFKRGDVPFAMKGWNQFQNWRGNGRVTATSVEELTNLARGANRYSHKPTGDDMPPGYFMWPAFRNVIPAIAESELKRIQALIDAHIR